MIGQLCVRRHANFPTAESQHPCGTFTSEEGGLSRRADIEAGDNGDTGWTALIVFDGLSYVLALACFLAARVMAVGWNVKSVY